MMTLQVLKSATNIPGNGRQGFCAKLFTNGCIQTGSIWEVVMDPKMKQAKSQVSSALTSTRHQL